MVSLGTLYQVLTRDLKMVVTYVSVYFYAKYVLFLFINDDRNLSWCCKYKKQRQHKIHSHCLHDVFCRWSVSGKGGQRYSSG